MNTTNNSTASLDDSSKRSDNYIRILIFVALIGLLGAAKPVIYNGGSSMAKYVANQYQLDMVQEDNVEAVFEAMVFGEEPPADGDVEAVDASEREAIIERIFTADRWVAWTLLLLPVLLLVPTILDKTPLYHVLLLNSLWLLAIALGVMLNGGKKFSELAIMAHATRWGLPLFIWYVIHRKRRTGNVLPLGRIGLWILIICSSLTFAVHGTEAILLNPPFQDLIYSFGAIFGIEVGTTTIHVLLRIIGTMDLAFAALVIWKRSRMVCPGMAIWGIVTALSRPVTMGFVAWPEAAMRIANGALPFILFYVCLKLKQQSNEKEPNITTEELDYENA